MTNYAIRQSIETKLAIAAVCRRRLSRATNCRTSLFSTFSHVPRLVGEAVKLANELDIRGRRAECFEVLGVDPLARSLRGGARGESSIVLAVRVDGSGEISVGLTLEQRGRGSSPSSAARVVARSSPPFEGRKRIQLRAGGKADRVGDLPDSTNVRAAFPAISPREPPIVSVVRREKIP